MPSGSRICQGKADIIDDPAFRQTKYGLNSLTEKQLFADSEVVVYLHVVSFVIVGVSAWSLAFYFSRCINYCIS